MRLLLLCSLLVLLISGCSRPVDRTLARQGRINQTAPVQAVTQIVIDAPIGHVWAVLANIEAWPGWQRDISGVIIKQKPGLGVRFEWSTGAGEIHSRLALFEPPEKMAWTGRLLIFHAIHIWTLTPLAGGQTLVQTRESMSGWPIGLFYSSADLRATDQRWLVDLKKQAES